MQASTAVGEAAAVEDHGVMRERFRPGEGSSPAVGVGFEAAKEGRLRWVAAIVRYAGKTFELRTEAENRICAETQLPAFFDGR